MRILITGNLGYVGPVVVRHLRQQWPETELIGFDTGFFAHLLTNTTVLPETLLNQQIFGDIRELPDALLEGVDAVIHLAAISNDPIGNEFATVTQEINWQASVRLALAAAKAGVKSFVFASSCSIYGHTEGGARKETDQPQPLTAYARSKVDTENSLATTDLGEMMVTSLRFPTACGMSERLRLDLVLNDFVASAVTTGEINVLSDGTPWRPLIDVEDMARAIVWSIQRPEENGGKFLIVNVGRNENNYQVMELAEAVARRVPGTSIRLNPNPLPDRRTYQVDFSLFKSLAPGFIPQVPLEESIDRLYNGLKQMKFTDRNFRQSSFVRLNVLRRYRERGLLDSKLRWKHDRSWLLNPTRAETHEATYP